jgi:hypothetical protein
VTDDGKAHSSSEFRNDTDVLQYRLFANDYTPVATSALADFTEPVWSGYAPIAVTLWADNGIVAGDSEIAVFTPTIQWVNGTSSNQDVYGWFMYDLSNGRVLAAQRWSTGAVTIAPGQQLLLQCKAHWGSRF